MTGPTNPKRADRWEDQVPILDAAAGIPDPIALATWHMAMSTLVAGELPHEIMALWVFPSRGGVVLLGPEALAQGQPAVPEPRPHLTQDQLFELEAIFRRAKYGSVIAVPVRTQAADVGLMLLAAFQPGRFGAAEALSLHWIARRLAPSMEGLARLFASVGQQAAIEAALTPEELPHALSRAAVEAPTGADLVRRLSGLLHALVPYDRLEIVAAVNGMNAVTALGSGPARRRWNAAGSTWADVVRFLEAERERSGAPAVLAIEDWVKQSDDLAWPGAPAGHPGRIGSAIAVKMTLGGDRVGWLIAAHSAQNVFRPADEEVIELAARLIAPRVASFRLEAELHMLEGRLQALAAPSLPVLRAAEALAGTAHLGEALHRIGTEVQELVPHRRIRYLLTIGEDRVVELGADSIRPLADSPTVLLTDSPARAVLDGERDWLLTRVGEGEALIVALRVADRIIGAMVIEAESFNAPRVSAGSALQFAAVVAPHLELIRRGAAGRSQQPAPFTQSAHRP